MKTYYHYTNIKNVKSILVNKAINRGLFKYVCDSKIDCLYFIEFYHSIGKIKFNDMAIIVFTTETPLKESFDHDKVCIPATAYFTTESIKIKSVESIFYFGE